MTISILHKQELGASIVYNNGVVNVQPDNTGNVQFEVTTTGLKGTVDLPQEFDPSALEQKIQELETAKQQAEAKIAQLEQDLANKPSVDVKLQGLTFADGKLKATLSDNSTAETDFNAEIVVTALEQADEAQKGRIVEALKDKLLEVLKGEELQDFAGNPKGYLITL